MTEEIITVVLGAEYDERLAGTLRQVMAELGAETIGSTWGVGGSQELSVAQVVLGGHLIEIEFETYMGLSIRGPMSTVRMLAESVRARMAEK